MKDERSEMRATIARIGARFRRRPDFRETFRNHWDRLAGTPERRRVLRKRTLIAAPIVLVAGGIAAWMIFGPVPQPDFRKGNLGKVFNYALLTDEFNRLPVERRLELIGELVSRLKNLDSSDSVLMAAFAAGIAGAAREQLEENASKLAIDVWDMYARNYKDVKPEDRAAYLDNAFIEFTKMMETVAGEARDISDAERLAEGRRQAQRDREELAKGRGPSGRMLGRMYSFMREDVGSHASVTQRSRGQQMVRDMVRRMRGEPISGPG